MGASSAMKRWQVSLSVILTTVLLGGMTDTVPAAPRVSVEVTPITFLQSGSPAITLLRALLHLESQDALGPAVLNLTLDPGVLLDLNGLGGSEWSWGLTEAYVQHRRGPFDLHIGVERLPLETARLMIPFLVEDIDMLGTRLGRAGIRLIWNPDSATRIRGALLEQSGAVFPALSVRRQFASFEFEGHALALSGGRTAFGLGGSGLAGRLVVYGEAWTVTSPLETRYAVGVSGSIPNGIWTLEAGNAAAAAVARLIPETGVRPQVAGQIAYRVSEEFSVTGTARMLADPDAVRSQLTLQLTRTAGNTDYSLTLTSLLGPEPRRDIITATISYSF
jgi:hypothetical protein